MAWAGHGRIRVLSLSESPWASGCQTPELHHIYISLLHCFINIESIRTDIIALAKEFFCSRSTVRSDGMRIGENWPSTAFAWLWEGILLSISKFWGHPPVQNDRTNKIRASNLDSAMQLSCWLLKVCLQRSNSYSFCFSFSHNPIYS